MSATTPIPVVCAVIERAGLILLAQRPANKHLPLKWEFPGGKVEAGEDAAAAIVREIREELGCAIEVSRPLNRFAHAYGPVVIEMIPYVCRLAQGSPEPLPHEHLAMTWSRADQAGSFDLAAADLPVIADYLNGLRD